MFELARSEFIRYQKWAFAVAVLLLAVFGFVSKIKPLLENSDAQSALVNLSFFGASLLFGVLQMALYKRTNHWTYLIHRPISPAKIYFALCGAGVLLLFIAFGLPWLIAMLGLDIFTETLVETRHYLHVAFLLFNAILVFLIGNLIVLNASYAIVGLLILLVIIYVPISPSIQMQFLPVISMILGLLYLNMKSFQPDLSRYLKQPFSVVLLSIPLSFALWFLLLMISTTSLYHLPKFIAGTHPDNNPVENTYRYIWQYDESELPEYILQNANTPLANNMIQQAKLAKVDYISTDFWPFPRKNQLYVEDLQYALTHKKTHSTWQFSHKDMVLVGVSKSTGKRVGVLGQQGFVSSLEKVTEQDRFSAVPFLLGESHFMTRTNIYQVNFNEKSLSNKFSLTQGEFFIGIPKIHDNYIAVATNQHILLFDPSSYRDEYQQIQPDYRVPHPVAYKTLSNITTYKLADGYLFHYFGTKHFGFDRPGAQMFYVKLSGETLYVGGREFTSFSHPAWIRHGLFVFSPVLWGTQNLMFDYLDPENGWALSYAEIREVNFPQQAITAAIVLHLVSLIGAIIMCRRHRMASAQVATWISLCLFLSLPGLLTCILLNPLRDERKPKTLNAESLPVT